MFDRVSEAAEKLATTVSRREFMGRLGRSAAVVAGVLGGLCAAPKLAEAGSPKGYVTCCNKNYTGACSPPMKNSVIVSYDCGGCVWKCQGRLMSSPCIIV